MRKKKIGKGMAITLLTTAMLSLNMAAPESSVMLISAFANEAITPYWSEVSSIAVGIDISGNVISAEVDIEGEEDNEKITGTMYLEKYSSGKWVRVKSWKISGKGHLFVHKTYRGKEGIEYRTRVVAKVGSETVEEFSDSRTV